MLAASPLLLLPLSEPVGVVAVRGEAAWWELGRVRLPAAPGAGVEIHLARAEGRGRWRAGLWWDDEAGPRWQDGERRLQRDAVLLPLGTLDDAAGEATARVMVEVLPLRPSTRAAAIFAAWFRG